jgi:hypothetical protein
MSKLTLDDLRKMHADRPNSIKQIVVPEIKKASMEEIFQVSAPVIEVSKKSKGSNLPLSLFIVFACVSLFAGAAVLIDYELGSNSKTSKVLGEQTVLEDDEDVENKGNEDSEMEGENAFILRLKEITEEERNREIIEEIMSDDSSPEEELDQIVMDEDFFEKDELTEEEESEESAEEEIVKVKVLEITGGYANLRVAPSANAAIKLRTESGTEFEFVSEKDGWTEIQYDEETTYWISSNLVEKM